MKKRVIIAVILSVGFVFAFLEIVHVMRNNSVPVAQGQSPSQSQNSLNLWNGLTSGMTEEQALLRVHEIAGAYGVVALNSHPDTQHTIGRVGFIIYPRVAIGELTYRFTRGLRVRQFRLGNPVYLQTEGLASAPADNLSLSFFDGRLIAVGVRWSTPAPTRNQMITQQFGAPRYNVPRAPSRPAPAWVAPGGLVIATWNFAPDGHNDEILFVDINRFRAAVNADARGSGMQF